MKNLLRVFGIGKKENKPIRLPEQKFHPTQWTANGELMPFMRKICFFYYPEQVIKEIVCCPSCKAWAINLILNLEDFDLPYAIPGEKSDRFCEICQEIF